MHVPPGMSQVQAASGPAPVPTLGDPASFPSPACAVVPPPPQAGAAGLGTCSLSLVIKLAGRLSRLPSLPCLLLPHWVSVCLPSCPGHCAGLGHASSLCLLPGARLGAPAGPASGPLSIWAQAAGPRVSERQCCFSIGLVGVLVPSRKGRARSQRSWGALRMKGPFPGTGQRTRGNKGWEALGLARRAVSPQA